MMTFQRGSMDGQSLMLMVGVTAVFLGALFLALRSNAKHVAALRGFAEARGWGFAERDAEGLSERLNQGFPDETYRVDSTITVARGAREVHFFECAYNARGKHKGDSFAAGCILVSERVRRLPVALEIVQRSALDSALLGHQVDMGEGPFGQAFIVQAKDAAAARSLLSEAMQRVLLEHQRAGRQSWVHLSLSQAWVAIIAGRSADPQAWLDLIAWVQELEAALP